MTRHPFHKNAEVCPRPCPRNTEVSLAFISKKCRDVPALHVGDISKSVHHPSNRNDDNVHVLCVHFRGMPRCAHGIFHRMLNYVQRSSHRNTEVCLASISEKYRGVLVTEMRGFTKLLYHKIAEAFRVKEISKCSWSACNRNAEVCRASKSKK